MNGLDNWLTEPKERDAVEFEDVDFNVDTSFVEEEDEDMECGGNIIGGVCDCHVCNCCPAVDGRSKVNPECPHKGWVMGYKFFYIRVMNQKAKEDYMANGI